MSTSQQPSLLQSLLKNYEQRTSKEHKLICNSIAGSFQSQSDQKIQLMTYYLQVRQGPLQIAVSQYSKHSFVIKFNMVTSESVSMMQMMTNKGVEVREGEFACVLDYQRYLNVEALEGSSIEKEVGFWESSQYFCSMPRKKIYQLLRQAEIRIFKENEVAFFQGQLMTKSQSGSGVFVVRKGQFRYYRQTDGKQIETFRFASGSIFGGLQILQEDSMRTMTARCKTIQSVIYHFSEQTFRRLMMKYCDAVILKKEEKLFRYLEKKNNSMFKSQSLGESLRKANQGSNKPLGLTVNFQSARSSMMTGRSFFPSLNDENRKTVKSNYVTGNFKQSLKLEQEGMKRTNYFSLRKEGPLKNYPMASQRSNYISSEFKVLDKLLAKKHIGMQDLKASSPVRQNGTWKREMIHSFYRQNFFKNTRGNPEN